MSEQSRFTDKDKAEKSDQLYETIEYSRRCLCDDIVELTFDNIKLKATIQKSEEDFANLQNKLMCSLLLILGSDDDVDRIIEKADELTRAFKDERVSTLQLENTKLRELVKDLMGHVTHPPCEGCMAEMNCDCSDLTQCDEWSLFEADARRLGIEVGG